MAASYLPSVQSVVLFAAATAAAVVAAAATATAIAAAAAAIVDYVITGGVSDVSFVCVLCFVS